MRIVLALCLGINLHASCAWEQIEQDSLLYASSRRALSYGAQIAKAPPPPSAPQTIRCLANSSIWYSVNPNDSLQTLADPELWDLLQEMGVDGVDLHSLAVASSNEADYGKIAAFANDRGIALIGSPFATLQLNGADFQLALSAYKEYSHLFHLIEIERADWNLLPRARMGDLAAPLPMSTVQDLRKLGYLAGPPEKIYPNTKTSCWAASAPIAGCDNKLRRWIFLQFPKTGVPAVNWLDPTFSGQRLVSGELIDAIFRLQQSVLSFDAMPLICRQMAGFSPSENTIESIALLTRKLGGFTAIRIDSSIEEAKQTPTDLLFDRFTPPAVLHALLTEDAEALRLIYRIFLQEGLQPRSLIHELRPFDSTPCEWTEFLLNPKRGYIYYEEHITGELLAERLLKEDLYNLNKTPSPYSPPIAPLFGLCPEPLSLPDLEQAKDELQKAHLLLAFFYAMQPGAISFSGFDLRGAGGSNPMQGPGLYHPLCRQLKSRKSFASRFQQMLSVRKDQQLQLAELIDVLPARNKGVLLLLHRLPLTHQISLTAVNFSRISAQETLRDPFLADKWIINLMNQQTESKLYGADVFDLQLPPLSGKVYVFQTKPYTQ